MQYHDSGSGGLAVPALIIGEVFIVAHAGTVSMHPEGFEDYVKRAELTMPPEEMQGELDYWRSRKILQKMLDVGLVTPDEFHKIDGLDRKSSILKKKTLIQLPFHESQK